MIKAIFYDLDNTLLDFNLNIFLYNYMTEFIQLISSILGRSYFALIPDFWKIMVEMMSDRNDTLTNEEFLAQRLKDYFGLEYYDPVIKDAFDYFFQEYAPESLKRRSATRPMPGGREAVIAALDLGLDIVLATNPVNPLPITRLRMEWANIDDLPFKAITHLGNCTRTKPFTQYYLETCEMAGCKPEEVIMVGNDPKRDILRNPNLGIRTYLMNGRCNDDAAWCGSLEQFPEFLRTYLPKL